MASRLPVLAQGPHGGPRGPRYHTTLMSNLQPSRLGAKAKLHACQHFNQSEYRGSVL
jgi:1,6-anhydro-N-acetylmuramate kinase